MNFLTKKVAQPNFTFGLDYGVKDKTTSFTGIVIGRHQWLNNCHTYTVQPTVLRDGVPLERQSFDEPQLGLLANGVIEGKNGTGGPEIPVSPT
ncbi:hypothetical protein JWJ90_13320 [Desulfobulbus rhabdoformis]|uniref:hypothetical protein n=1 Tax=Desulfobulbus rhabdoformis TaxID=34032 RepID=UPI001962BE22|nr:hypothetical protein [Desulfobulbus rhabdoformis]MBM9615260.1 hypothetical protein [Desulfobulbus rhabdoformis]